jgi:DNA-binding NarL/FixJ family response regulator
MTADGAPDGEIRVLLAEADEILVAVLERCLASPEFTTTRGPSDTAGLLDVAAECRANVVIVGPTFPRSGLDRVVPRLLAHGSRTLILSETSLDDASSLLLLAGASGFLLIQDATTESVAEAVTTVARGSTALHPDVIHAVLDQWRRTRAATASDAAQPESRPALTARELDVLQGLRDGLTSRMLAARLGVAEKTIETHKSRLYTKLGARNQAHAVRIAADRGIL